MSVAIRTAFVLGAGLGTRLKPLTDMRPKPLIPIFGKPLITFAMDQLAALGVENFVINTHHLPGQFDAYFSSGEYGGRPVKLVYEPVLLETGGGIKNAEPWIGQDIFIVYSGDILTDMPLAPLVEEHLRLGNDVTLALRDTGLARGIAIEKNRIVEIRGKQNREDAYDFANVSVWSSEIFRQISPGEKTSFIPVLTRWLAEGGKIGGIVLNENHWFNIGSRAEYLKVHRTIEELCWKPPYVTDPHWPVRVDPTASIGPGVELSGFASVGPHCRIGERSLVRDTILWDKAEIASRAHVEGCILRDGGRAEGILRDADI